MAVGEARRAVERGTSVIAVGWDAIAVAAISDATGLNAGISVEIVTTDRAAPAERAALKSSPRVRLALTAAMSAPRTLAGWPLARDTIGRDPVAAAAAVTTGCPAAKRDGGRAEGQSQSETRHGHRRDTHLHHFDTPNARPRDPLGSIGNVDRSKRYGSFAW